MTGRRACWRERGHSYRSICSYRKLPPPACPGTACILYLYIPGTHLTSVLIGKDHILGGWWSKIEVIQVLGVEREREGEERQTESVSGAA